MTEFKNQWLEALALDIQQLYIDERDPDLSTLVERIVEFVRHWRK